jgi:O-antigen/teichoic acid export membrane protein
MSDHADSASLRHSETKTMAMASVVARVFNAGLVFLTQILFARLMGASEFGVYATANTIMLLVAGVATLGLVTMPQRFLPEYEEQGDEAKVRGLVRFAAWGPFAIGSVFCIMGAAVILLARDILSPPVATAACVALLVVPALASLDIVEGIALAKAWKALAYGVAFVIRPLITPVVFLAAWMAGVTADATLAMASLVIATWIAAGLLLVLVRRRLKTILPSGPVSHERRRWIMAGLPVMVIHAAFMLMTSTDIVALSFFRNDAEVGAYSAAARLVALVAFVHHGLTWASGHHFSALHAAGEREKLAAFSARTTLWTFLPSVVAAAAVALAAPLFLLLFGKDFTGGASITAVLLLGLLARAAIGPAEQLLIMTDHQLACAKAYGWAFAINLMLCLLLVPTYGGNGAAAATALAYGAASLILARQVWLKLGFHVHVLALMLPSARKPVHV